MKSLMKALGDGLVLLTALTLSGCSGEPETVRDYPHQVLHFDEAAIVLDTFPITEPDRIGYPEGFAHMELEADTAGVRDEYGNPLFKYHDSLYYHPLILARRAARLRGSFEHTADSAYLRAAIQTFDILESLAVVEDGAMWLGYPFTYDVHQNEEFRLAAPWYSGMTQGVALTAACGLFATTGDSLYLSVADQLFASYTQLWSGDGPWVARVDSLGYYWLEEYPLDWPGMTLNGAIIGMMGFREYWGVTGSAQAERAMRGALATFAYYGPQFRRPGELSFYCLEHRQVAGRGYHDLHTYLYRWLDGISENPVFGQIADSLEADGATAD